MMREGGKSKHSWKTALLSTGLVRKKGKEVEPPLFFDISGEDPARAQTENDRKKAIV